MSWKKEINHKLLSNLERFSQHIGTNEKEKGRMFQGMRAALATMILAVCFNS
jgi:hypothetical protein